MANFVSLVLPAEYIPNLLRKVLLVALPAVQTVLHRALSAQFKAVRPMPPEPACTRRLEDLECILHAAMLSASSVVVQMVTKPAASWNEIFGQIS